MYIRSFHVDVMNNLVKGVLIFHSPNSTIYPLKYRLYVYFSQREV